MSPPNNESSTSNQECTSFETTYQNSEGLSSHAAYESNEQLKPHLNRTFEPTKSMEGIQSNHNHGNHQQRNTLERQKTSVNYSSMDLTKVMSENEKLDEQMRNGTDYINLPTHIYPTDRAPTWIPQQGISNTYQIQPREIRYLHHIRPSTTGSQLSRDHYGNHQQMDAENRLQHLEVIRPTENINLLNVKFRTLQHPRHARPILPQYRDHYVNTFYDQTGSYVQERSGLYHTDNYEPSSLGQAIPELENQEGSYTTINDESNLGDLLDKAEQDQNRAKPQLFQYKAIGDYENMRNRLLNRFRVSNDSATVDCRTQEGNKQFVQRESIYGLSYNTPKFLQENTLAYHARIDPSRLMSTRYNNNLDQVRNFNSYPTKPTKNASVTNNTLVSPILHPSPYDELYATKHITEHTDGYSHRSTVRVYDSPFKTKQIPNFNKPNCQQQQQQSNSFDPILSIPTQLPRAVKTDLRLPGPEIVARFIEPKLEPRTTHQRSYKDISYHEITPQIKGNNQRFNPTSVNHIKQLKLLDLQSRWSKTQAQQQYHIEHPEPVPKLGDSVMRAKKEILIADAIIKQGLLTIR